MDQKIKDQVRNCFQTAYELQRAISKKFTMGYDILMVHTVTEEGISDQDAANSRKDFSNGYVRLTKEFDRYKQKDLMNKLQEYKSCATILRQNAKESKLVSDYAMDCYQEFVKKQQG